MSIAVDDLVFFVCHGCTFPSICHSEERSGEESSLIF